jgi:hypothetical protein
VPSASISALVSQYQHRWASRAVMDRTRCRMRFISRVTKKGRATSSNVQQLLTAAASISLFCCTVALAQSNTPPRQQTVKSSITSLRRPLGTVSRPHVTFPQLKEAMTTDCWATTQMTRRWIAKLRASAAVASRRIDESRFKKRLCIGEEAREVGAPVGHANCLCVRGSDHERRLCCYAIGAIRSTTAPGASLGLHGSAIAQLLSAP